MADLETPVIKKLGKERKKDDARNLMAARYLASEFPASYDWQKRRRLLPARTFGNTSYGDCTLASQANALMRFERMEQRRTVVIPDQTVIQNYLEMTGGEDSGWYELEALKRWRTTGFNTRADRKYTIDGFAEINPRNIDEMKAAIYQFKVVKVCFGLPWAWSAIDPPGYASASSTEGPWDIGEGPDYEAYSWGGHSMMTDWYDDIGLYAVHTWYEGAKPARQLVTWAAVQAYCDEAYSVVDSFNSWRKKAIFDVAAMEQDVREVTA